MTKLYDLQAIIVATGLTERTARYYLAKLLKTPPGTPGRKSYYDQATVDRLILAQRILSQDYDPGRGEVRPSLKELRDWLQGLTEDEAHELAMAPYRIKPKSLVMAAQPSEAPQQVSSSSSNSIDELRASIASQFSAMKTADKLSFLEEAGDEKDNSSSLADLPAGTKLPADDWEIHGFGSGLQIRTRQKLDDKQRQQIEHIGQLLRSLLD